MQPVPDEGIEWLVHLAKTGQIDPWNVDIVAVTDQYLAEVQRREQVSSESENLKQTGKTLLYLAILLRMKSDLLAGLDPFELEPEEDPFLDEELSDAFDEKSSNVRQFRPRPARSLEEVIKRRNSTKQPRIRPVTLDDLIQQLKKYEDLEKRRALRDRLETGDSRRQTMVDYGHFTSDDIDEMAHDESIEEAVDRMERVLDPLLFDDQETVSLTTLEEVAQVDQVTGFLALLFLEARHLVEVHQEEFYAEEVWARRPVESVPAEPMFDDAILGDDLLDDTTSTSSDKSSGEAA